MNALTKALNAFQTLFKGEETGFKVVGNNWFAVYSNAFKDREDEYFPRKAIDAFIDRVDHGLVPLPELWVWHEPLRLGKAKSIARVGLFVVAAGTFDDTAHAQAAKAYLKKHKMKLSHGFHFNPEVFKDSAYWEYNTFEISVLPPQAAANAYTGIEVKDMVMTDAKKKLFESMFPDEAETLLTQLDSTSKAMIEAGVAHKEFSDIAALKAEGDDDDMPDEEDDDEKEDEKALGLKALYGELAGSQAELAEGQLALTKAIKSLVGEINTLKASNASAQKDAATALKAAQDEIKALQAELSLDPKRASQSNDTTTADDDLQKSLNEKEQGQKDDVWAWAKD